MSRVYNFSAGPAALPTPVLEQIAAEALEWNGQGASVMELSHRSKAFIALAERAEASLRRLLAVPSNYKVLFLQGGATQHFAQIPLNLTAPGERADYVLTGSWGKKAISHAQPYCQARVAASTEAERYLTAPADYDFDPSAAYVHLTPNETIGGVELHELPDTGEVPVVADLSSAILSQPLDVSRYGLIYAGAQKNIGPSGLVVLIIRDDLLARSGHAKAQIFSYRAHAEAGSMLNTPPTFAWYVAALVFEWLEREGGLVEIGARNQRKAQALYSYIDASGYYRNPVAVAVRSRMNVPFLLADAALDSRFIAEAEAAGLHALAGHRDVGGMRASLYNAMPEAGVAALIEFMGDFARRHG